MIGGKTKSSPSVLNGFLDRGSRIKGELSFEDTFRIDGRFEGTIVSDHELVVGETGEVDGEIRVARVSINGLVKGKMIVKERAEIHGAARVFAEIHAAALVVEEGAVIQGPVETGASGVKEAVPRTPGDVRQSAGSTLEVRPGAANAPGPTHDARAGQAQAGTGKKS